MAKKITKNIIREDSTTGKIFNKAKRCKVKAPMSANNQNAPIHFLIKIPPIILYAVRANIRTEFLLVILVNT